MGNKKIIIWGSAIIIGGYLAYKYLFPSKAKMAASGALAQTDSDGYKHISYSGGSGKKYTFTQDYVAESFVTPTNKFKISFKKGDTINADFYPDSDNDDFVSTTSDGGFPNFSIIGQSCFSIPVDILYPTPVKNQIESIFNQFNQSNQSDISAEFKKNRGRDPISNDVYLYKGNIYKYNSNQCIIAPCTGGYWVGDESTFARPT